MDPRDEGSDLTRDDEGPTGRTAPSPFITRYSSLLRPEGRILDVAAGRGRHTRFLLQAGHAVVAVDRDVSGLQDLKEHPDLEVVAADLENGPWPFPDQRFTGVVVTNYLHRPLLPVLVEALASAGVLLYETFSEGHERFGRPRNPAWLLRHGELLELVRGRLRVVAYEDVETPRPARVQRIAAVREIDPDLQDP